ncbi:hypothetical protein GCM10018980_66830 [Streptomyces capoamus]|uniref:Uncharacterized protein n=1 Tax=Streptomyces capoamus TaxID=68183 RepID=A0A919F2N1_9ACTN|nr:hypothetical protein GCM10010501_54950 [Streptomyces libani subsp. rufus]GHG71495.1 hypothetical protein GCM10018980_66830 [Streptomyces capoamus]
MAPGGSRGWLLRLVIAFCRRSGGVAAPFVMPGALLLLSSGVAVRSPGRPGDSAGRVAGKGA